MNLAIGQRFGALTYLGRHRWSGVACAACECACGRVGMFSVEALLAGEALDCRRCKHIRLGWRRGCLVGRGETYVVASCGLYKIGWSTDVARRTAEIGRDAIALLRVPGAEHEALLHRLCFESHDHREWFRSDEHTRALIADLAALPMAARGARVRDLYRARFSTPGSVACLRRFASAATRDEPVSKAA